MTFGISELAFQEVEENMISGVQLLRPTICSYSIVKAENIPMHIFFISESTVTEYRLGYGAYSTR